MSSRKRRIKRKIEMIVRMDRQARGYCNKHKCETMCANIIALAIGIKKHGGNDKGVVALLYSRKHDKAIWRPKFEFITIK